MGILRRLFGRKHAPLLEVANAQDSSSGKSGPASPSFYTSTATIVVYDLESLRHRLDDDVDWWADPEAEIDEINRRNVLIVGLGFDGFYDLDIVEEDIGAQSYSLRFPSGKIFIGPGEALTGGGDEPDESCGGLFLNLPAGDYKVGINGSEDRLRVSIVPAAPFDNAIMESIRL
ncbi:MAG TPA: DUF6386 family protein [Sphingobium sp.]|uniref:DUF6386 family protein n=1 Tax=Sphingobium sp. TaxID=1912891 RepID=UPI002ED65312